MSDQQTCSICEQQPEDLLILSCHHNLCVSCATEVYALNPHPKLFVCEICLSQTQLDEETIACLSEMTKTETQPPPVQKPPKPKSKAPKPVPSNICPIHKQTCIYFCFDCQTSQICSECILTTKHSNHRVFTLKKANGMIYKKLNQQIRSKQSLKDQLYCEKNRYGEEKHQLKNEIEQYKEEVKDIFDEIVRIISQKYAGICTELEESMRRKEEMIDGCILQINEKIDLIEETLEMEKKIIAGKNENEAYQYFQAVHETHQDFYLPKLPQQLPEIQGSLLHHESATEEIKKILGNICWESAQKGHRQSLHCSVIEKEKYSVMDEHPRAAVPVLQESLQCSNSRSYMPRSNRKLDLSRSIDNATNIINKLQQRSKTHYDQ